MKHKPLSILARNNGGGKAWRAQLGMSPFVIAPQDLIHTGPAEPFSGGSAPAGGTHFTLGF